MRIVIEEYGRKLHHKLKVEKGNISSKIGSRGNFSITNLKILFISIFLPQGYPHSVTDDYLHYQIWDTIQAFASSMTGALATEAVLKGAGVGNESATALAASLTWLVKDGLGMIGRITFSYCRGSQLDFDCKKWRLVADILNDVAFCIDLLSPLWPHYFLFSACFSSLFRCVVGVAGGSTRTTIVQHQARRNNLADVAAKDGSQETLVNAIALIASIALLPAVSGKQPLIWCLFVLFTFIHLFANWRAVRSLQLEVLNGKRFGICMKQFLVNGSVPSVADANAVEPLFYNVTSARHLGCSLEKLLTERRHDGMIYKELDDCVILIDPQSKVGWISMQNGTDFHSQLRALFHLESLISGKTADFNLFLQRLKEKGWTTDVHHLNFDEWTYKYE